MSRILVTGGLGYIGSHTVIKLLENKHDVIIIDNLSNSKIETLDKIKQITKEQPRLYVKDLRIKSDIDYVFERELVDKVIHFAAYKSSNKSIKKPFEYYENNIISTINLLKTMDEHKVKDIIFSSTAAVYGNNPNVPYDEDDKLMPITPYASSKYMVELLLEDLQRIDKINGISLRYFNPLGSHPTGFIGERFSSEPENLMGHIVSVARGDSKEIFIFGNDYYTADGTGVRDYIHIEDLAEGHLAALDYLDNNKKFNIFNLGSSKCYSVMEVIRTFSKVNDVKIPYSFSDRRKGDAPVSYANTNKARNILKWESTKNLADMCRDTWFWAKKDR